MAENSEPVPWPLGDALKTLLIWYVSGPRDNSREKIYGKWKWFFQSRIRSFNLFLWLL